ncbi:MAG TPA: type VI secretion system tube protein Hcp [Candidatus Kapabacteria bacterium]|nr:type VI secretion system tube protein Hcp [Candidatus Kapabacteria bacterium]
MTSSKRLSLILAVVLMAFSITSTTYAASDYYLKIEGIKGERARIVKCPNGACKLDGIAPGTLTVTVCDASGKPLTTNNFSLDMTFTVQSSRDVATGMATGKTATVSSTGTASPRDAASGLATGKRQHSPIRITKEIDKSSPLTKVATPTQDCDDVSMWAVEVRVQKIEMK